MTVQSHWAHLVQHNNINKERHIARKGKPRKCAFSVYKRAPSIDESLPTRWGSVSCFNLRLHVVDEVMRLYRNFNGMSIVVPKTNTNLQQRVPARNITQVEEISKTQVPVSPFSWREQDSP